MSEIHFNWPQNSDIINKQLAKLVSISIPIEFNLKI